MLNQLIKVSCSATALAALAVLTVARPAFAIPRGPDDPPNPFQNLEQAQKDVAKREKGAATIKINLMSPDVDGTMRRLTSLLTLSPGEQSAIKDHLQAENQRAMAARQDNGLSAEARAIRLEAIYRVTQYQVSRELSAEQSLQFRIDQEQANQDPSLVLTDKLFTLDARYAKSPVASDVSQWSERLSFTFAQRHQLIPIVEDEIRGLDALAADTTLSPDDEEIRSQEVMIDSERKIGKLLTPTQQVYLTSALIFGVGPTPVNPRAVSVATKTASTSPAAP